MIRHTHANGVITLEFEQLQNAPVRGHVATRHGGVSPAPWSSLNFSVSRGDTPERVAKNRQRLAAALGVDAQRMVRCQQVHGVQVHRVGAEQGGRVQGPGDALITAECHVPLALVFADCVPVLLYDARNHALGVCHAGWRGTVAGAAAKTLRAMQEAFGTRSADVHAGIGPSIGPESYAVGPDVWESAQAALPFADACFSEPSSSQLHFDLWQANRLQLEAEGVPAANIDVSGIDTAQNTQDFFSHRAERGQCGLFTMVAWLA